MLIHAGPGAGKTLGALLGFKTMKSEGLLTKFLVFCHRNSIVSQWIKSAEMLGLKLKEFEEYQDFRNLPMDLDGLILTYQGAARNQEELLKHQLMKFNGNDLLAIADEAHHLGVNPDEPEGPAWGRAFLELTLNFKLRLGLTGTPFRADNLAFCSARKVRLHGEGEHIEQITPDLCVEPRELIAAGDVRPLEFHFQDGLVEHSREGQPDREISSISSEQRETWRARNLRRAIRLADSSSIALHLLLRARKKLEIISSEHPDAAGLVIAKDIGHASAIANFLKENGEEVELVHSQDSDSSNRLVAFQNSSAKWLVSVDMCSEGFDAPRLRVVAYLTTVVTRSRFIQGITRTVRISPKRAVLEPIPRKPSFVFAPADPLLMEYARSWSIAKPYLIRGNEMTSSIGSGHWISRGPSLPMEAVNEVVGQMITMKAAELPKIAKG